MRNAFAETLYSYAKTDKDIFIVAADISPAGSMTKFKVECANRFIDVGVAEQSMIGICAGLALRGCRPYAYTIATFTLFRPFEFIRVDLCYQNLPVTLVGVGAGLVYSNLGGTHQAHEDIAIASALPNMQIIAPCDPLETEAATIFSATENKGPLYLRLGKSGEPILTEKAEPFKVGKIRYLRRGKDICFIGYGPLLAKSVDLADKFEKLGYSTSVISNHTLKPLDVDGLKQALLTHKQVVVIEEHVPSGSLSGNVKQLAWDIRAKCNLFTYTLTDQFIHFYGSHDELLKMRGICPEKIFEEIYSHITSKQEATIA